jgi:hypothetical protein
LASPESILLQVEKLGCFAKQHEDQVSTGRLKVKTTVELYLTGIWIAGNLSKTPPWGLLLFPLERFLRG